MKKAVQIKDYSSSFLKAYKKEEERLKNLLKRFDKVIVEHIGSTKVEGLSGKGIIDILIVLKDFKEAVQVLEILKNNGLYHKETTGSKGRIFLSDAPLDSKNVKFHYHIVECNSTDHKNPIYFRDALIADKSLAKEYEDLKNRLAATAINPRDYREGKSNFIKSILKSKKRD